MSELIEVRAFNGSVPVPGLTPSFLHVVYRDGLPAMTPVVSDRGNGKYLFEISDAEAARGVAYMLDFGAGATNRYVVGSVVAPGVLPIAAMAFYDLAGDLYAGTDAPDVSDDDYETADGTVRTAPAMVEVATYFWLLSPSQGDIDAGGVAYVVNAPPASVPESYDGSFDDGGGWNYDPSTDVGRVRLLIGDTNTLDRLLSDDEIQFFLTQAGDNLYAAAVAACYAIAAKYSRQADFTNLSLSVSASQRSEHYRQLAKDLAAQALTDAGATMFVGGATVSGKRALQADTDATQPSFSIGQDDEPGTDSRSPVPGRWGT